MSNTSSTLGPNVTPPNGETEEVLAALDRLLQSDVFAGAARQQRLLRHLVNKRLQNAVSDLKEYTLGVEVFDRGEDFDPRLDPIVRVEASRLRSRLQKYYDGVGGAEPLRITLPRGGYVPAFLPATPPPEVAPELLPTESAASAPITEAIPAPKKVQSWLWVVGLIALVAVVAAVVLVRRTAPKPQLSEFDRFRRLTNDEAVCGFPTFSPDGQTIAYARREAGTWEIYQRVLATSAVTELTPDSLDDNYQPAWSPNGANIAFRSDREGGGLYLLNTQSRKTSRVSTIGYYPSWSPDSSKLAFSTGTFSDPSENPSIGDSAIDVLDLKTKQIRQLTPSGSGSSALQPAWSPHGNRIAFWDTNPNGDRDIWTIGVDGDSARVPVTHDAWTDWSPAWSPDGRYLYFSSDRGGAMNLWRIRIHEDSGRVEGAPESVTTPSSYTGWATISSTGKELAYVRRIPLSELYRTPFDPNKPVDLNQKTALTSGERIMHEPDISPDGKWIVVRIQDPQEDLALIRSSGSDMRRLTNDVYEDRDPHWSPDGKWIVFISNRSHRFEIWAIHPDGTGLEPLTRDGIVPFAWDPDGVLVAYPSNGAPYSLLPHGAPVKGFGLPPLFRPFAWSPNHEQVAGRLRSGGFARNSLFVLTPAKQDYWQVASDAPYASTAWLQNSKQLLFSRTEGIYMADVLSHQSKLELPTAKSDIRPRFTLSPDNHSLFFVESDDQQDIWLGQ